MSFDHKLAERFETALEKAGDRLVFPDISAVRPATPKGLEYFGGAHDTLNYLDVLEKLNREEESVVSTLIQGSRDYFSFFFGDFLQRPNVFLAEATVKEMLSLSNYGSHEQVDSARIEIANSLLDHMVLIPREKIVSCPATGVLDSFVPKLEGVANETDAEIFRTGIEYAVDQKEGGVEFWSRDWDFANLVDVYREIQEGDVTLPNAYRRMAYSEFGRNTKERKGLKVTTEAVAA
tara:strand:- start:385 stop:1089 length:705 start_codon:yes stop_codon:yes gene_type:complete